MGIPVLTDAELDQPNLVAERLRVATQAHQQFAGACANGQFMKVASFLEMFPYLAHFKRNYKSPLIEAVKGGQTEIRLLPFKGNDLVSVREALECHSLGFTNLNAVE